MKKILMVAVALMMTVTASAQKGEMAVGGNLSIGLKSSTHNFGVGGKYQYNVLEHLRLEASGDYFFKHDNMSLWDINVNVQYLFNVGKAKKCKIYPLGGFALLGAKAHLKDIWGGDNYSDTYPGFNLGAGVEYPFTEHFKISFETKTQWVKDYHARGVLSLGAAYVF